MSPWLIRTATATAMLVVASYVAHQENGSRASAVAADRTEAEANRIRISRSDADRLSVPRSAEPVRSILTVRKRLSYGDFVWDDAGVPPGNVWIRIDLASQLLSIFRGGDEIGTAVVMYGGNGKPTPSGQFAVLWKKEKHRSSLYDGKMPYTLRLTGDGISIHGADVRAGTATNGCVSVPVEFARLLFAQVPVGTAVMILNEKPAPPSPRTA